MPKNIPQEKPGSRVTQLENGIVSIECGIDFTNGYRIRVWWGMRRGTRG